MKFESLQQRIAAAGLDFTGDDVVDMADVDRLCFEIQNVDYSIPIEIAIENNRDWYAQYDLDGDGVPTAVDFDMYLAEEFGTVRGDINLDGVANVDDFAELWNTRGISDLYFGQWTDGGAYSSGNLGCQTGGWHPVERYYPDIERGVFAEMFVHNNGDLTSDGVFDSSDLVFLMQSGQNREVETSEIVDLFAAGFYENGMDVIEE